MTKCWEPACHSEDYDRLYLVFSTLKSAKFEFEVEKFVNLQVKGFIGLRCSVKYVLGGFI